MRVCHLGIFLVAAFRDGGLAPVAALGRKSDGEPGHDTPTAPDAGHGSGGASGQQPPDAGHGSGGASGKQPPDAGHGSGGASGKQPPDAGHGSGGASGEHPTEDCDPSGHGQGGGSHRRLNSESPWYCEPWEKDFLEEVIAACFLLVALAFEHVFNSASHHAEESYVYGMSLVASEDHEAKNIARVFGKPLMSSLIHRMGGEFMVLGFLAFSVWVFNQAGVFALFARIDVGSLRLPENGQDYLHLVEKVHIQLFVAMTIYFMIAFRAATGCNKFAKNIEDCRTEWVEQLKMGTADHLEEDPPALRTFKIWRRHFVQRALPRMLYWRSKKPEAFRRLLESMGLDGTDRLPEQITLEELQQAFEGCFSFATYIVFSVRKCVEDMIHLKTPTMLGIVFWHVFVGCIHYFTKRRTEDVLPFFVLFAVSLVLGVCAFTETVKCGLETDQEEGIPGFRCAPQALVRLCEAMNVELTVLRILQCLFFFTSYGLAGQLVTTVFWTGLFTGKDPGHVSLTLTYAAAVATLAIVIARLVPGFAAVTAMPPFFDQMNENMVVRVMVAGGATGACWAPFVDEKNIQMVRSRGKDGVMQAVRELVEGMRLEEGHDLPPSGDPDAPCPRTKAEEERVVDAFCDLLTSWETPDDTEDLTDVRVARRLKKLHTVLRKEMGKFSVPANTFRASHHAGRSHPVGHMGTGRRRSGHGAVCLDQSVPLNVEMTLRAEGRSLRHSITG